MSLVSSFEKLMRKYGEKLVKMKNTFDESENVEFGYRALYFCFVFKGKGSRKMIGEVQFTLDEISAIKSRMHLYYTVLFIEVRRLTNLASEDDTCCTYCYICYYCVLYCISTVCT